MKTTSLSFLEESPVLPLCIQQTDRGIERDRYKRGAEIKEGRETVRGRGDRGEGRERGRKRKNPIYN
jgi:hypothetical protein